MTEPALAESIKGYGRMYRHPVNGELYPSVTNIIDVLAKPWLAGWKAKMVAGHAWDNRFALIKIGDRDAAVDMLKGGPTRARNNAAAIGDLVHSYAEAVAAGTEPPVIPAELKPHVMSFLAFLEEYQPRFVALEGCIFRGGPEDEDRYAGSFDFLAEFARFGLLGDYKSGERVYAEVALQLAALRHGDELWDEKTGNLMPMPKVDACIAVHLRPGTLGVHVIDAGDAAFRAFLGLRQAWPWDKDHTGAVGPTMNRVRLVKELGRPDTLLEQLEQSVEQSVPGHGNEGSPAAETEGDGSKSRRSASPKTPVTVPPSPAGDTDA